jgi:hypothetical protein
MYGLPKDLDLSVFVGATLNTITFAAFNIYFGFDAGRIRITVMKAFLSGIQIVDPYFTINDPSKQAIIPSTTARNVVTTKR